MVLLVLETSTPQFSACRAAQGVVLAQEQNDVLLAFATTTCEGDATIAPSFVPR